MRPRRKENNRGNSPKRDREFNIISKAMPFVTTNETAMEMYFCIKLYKSEYPSYYKLTLLKSMWLTQIDNMDSKKGDILDII